MNQRFVAAVQEMAENRTVNQDTLSQLTLGRNIGLLLHCSHEIDQSTVLYLTVNGLPLLESDTFLFLFSENSSPNEEQIGGHGLYHRAFLYSVLERVVSDALWGHFNFCTCQIDGRLVAIVNFAKQLLPAIQPGVMAKLKETCYKIIEQARSEYDLQISVHCSGLIRQPQVLSAAYHRLLNEVTFFRFTGTNMTNMVSGFSSAVYHSYHEIAELITAHAQRLIQLIANQNDTTDYLHMALTDLCNIRPFSISVLQTRLQSFQEAIYLELTNREILRSVSIDITEQFAMIASAPSIQDVELVIQGSLDTIAVAYQKQVLDNSFQRIRLVEQYLMERLQEPGLTLMQVAEEFHENPSALTSRFKQYYHETIYAFVKKKRLELAVQHLDSNLTVREIAAECGFGSVESLYRAFRREYGITPSQMRKQRNRDHG